MKKNFLFYKEFHDGSMVVIDNLSKTKASRLYKEALEDWSDLELKGCGWEEKLEPLSLSQEIKYKKSGLTA